jgi:hypothetical protein
LHASQPSAHALSHLNSYPLKIEEVAQSYKE